MLLILITVVLSLIIINHYWTNWNHYKVWWRTPGPWSLPLVGSIGYFLSQRGNPLDGIVSTMKSYGTDRISLWLGPRFLFVTQDPRDFEIVLTHPDCIDKFDMIYDKLEAIVGNGLIRSKTDHWRKHRRLFSPAFTKTVLESFIGDLYKTSCRLVDEIRKDYGDKERDISYFMYNFAICAFCANFMGVDVEELNRKHHWGTMLQRGNKLTSQRMFVPQYMFDFVFNLLPKSKEYHQVVNEVRQFSTDALEMASKTQQNPPDGRNGDMKRKILLELMLELEHDQKLSIDDFHDELKTFLIGGTDTTGLTLSFIAVILGMYPEIQETVHQEVLEVCGRSNPIMLDQLHELKYLERVINEVMRLFPLVPQVARQTRNYVDLGDIVLPPGTGVGALVYNVHRDDRFWKDPLRFDPDRFLPEECAKRNPYTFLPFLIGPRNCIGMKYAMFQLKIAIANLVRNFKLHSKYRKIEEIEVVTRVFAKMRDGFQCKIESRL